MSQRGSHAIRCLPAAGALAVVALAASLGTAAAAPEPQAGTLAADGKSVRWSGELTVPLSPPVAETCAGQCDEFTLEVALPEGTFRRPGNVQIGVRWVDEAQDANLYVYGPGGELVGRSSGVFASTAESVAVDRAVNGTYRVVVVPVFTDDEPMPYTGVAQVERPPRANPQRRLLPNLKAVKPRNIHFSIGAYLFDPQTPAGELSSCYPEEILEQGASRCMRFDQIIANTGEGPFELRYRMEGVVNGDRQLRQRIYRSDGTYTDRVADTYEFHAAHAHFHYKNFGLSKLWPASTSGKRVGTKPVRVGKKNGFCMIDVENIWFGRTGDWARTYYFPRCNAPTETDETGTYMTNGISPGWADVYNWFLADQFIDVAGLADGCYVLQTISDPLDTIVESNERDNAISALVRLEGDRGTFVRKADERTACR